MLDLQDGQVLLAEAPDLALPLLDAHRGRGGGARRRRLPARRRRRAGARAPGALGPGGARGARRDRPCGPRGGGRPVPLAGRASRRRARGHRRVAGGGPRAGAGRRPQAALRAGRGRLAALGPDRRALCAVRRRARAWTRPPSPTSCTRPRSATSTTPIARWDRRAAVQEELRERLEAGRELRIVGPGTDLDAARRRPHVGRSSAANRNLPDGEVFTGPVEDSAEGVVSLPLPTHRGGRRIDGRAAHAASAARSSRPPPTRARTCCARRSASTRARAGWARSASARTTR